MKNWLHLKGKKVVVVADRVEYRGTLTELGEANVTLRAPGGHRQIPWGQISSIREDKGRIGPRAPSALG